AQPGAAQTGLRVTAALEVRLRARLDEIGRTANATPFVVLLALTSSYLHRIGGQNDLLIGFGVSGRCDDARFARAVGYAAHVAVLRSTHREAEPFDAFLRATSDRVREALEHQDFAFADLLRSLDVGWTPGRAPLVDVVVNLDRRRSSGDDAGVRALPTPIVGAKFPITINALDLGPGTPIQLDIDVDTRLFSPDAAARLVSDLIRWAETVAADPTAVIAAERNATELQAAPAPAPQPDPPPLAAASNAALEAQLAEIWATILGQPPAARDEDFFQAGGHSVQALRFILAVRERCGADVPVRAFFERPTVAGLAELVAAADAADATGLADRPTEIPRVARDARRVRRGSITGEAATEIAT
nr:condensation domain-containing protein [Candidatus Eremiobacteraeota bacterium]